MNEDVERADSANAESGDAAGGIADRSDAQSDTTKVQIRRVANVEPVTELSYSPIRTPELDARPHSSGREHWQPDPNVDVFEVSADIAYAAVATGAFEVTETSRVKLKGGL